MAASPTDPAGHDAFEDIEDTRPARDPMSEPTGLLAGIPEIAGREALEDRLDPATDEARRAADSGDLGLEDNDELTTGDAAD